MTFQSEFVPLALDQLHREAAIMKMEGWRFIQTHAVNTDDGVDLYYSFMKAGRVINYRVAGVKKDQQVPSITDLFLAAFVFENEARELFGVDMRDIAIDFGGAMYAPAVQEPMTIISPEQKAARDKARKAAAAKAAKESTTGDAKPAEEPPAKARFVMTPERRARLDAKLATMSPEKVAKVEAALKAREAEASQAASAPEVGTTPEKAADQPAKKAEAPESAVGQSAKDVALEEKLAAMDPAKAAKVRAALSGEPVAAVAAEVVQGDSRTAETHVKDAQLETLIALMDDAKAAKVREALNQKGGE